MRIAPAALAICGVLAAAVPSAAQTAPVPKPAGARANRELSIGGIYTAPSSMGSADAVLLGGNGSSSVTLFSTQNTMGSGFGPDLLLSFRMGRTTWVEADAGLAWTSLKTNVTHDFEGASNLSLSAGVIRWSTEGALLWFFHDGAKTSWFIRASGGVVGEVANDLSLSEVGFTGGGGVGVRHWWRTNGTGAFKRVGLRAEFRGNVQSGGISLQSSSVRFVPTATAHLVIGY